MAGACDVLLIGRASLRDQLAASGLTLTDLAGNRVTLPPERIAYATDFSAAKDADVIVITVKGKDTPEVASAIAPHLKSDAVVISLQNGVRNASRAAACLPGRTVLSAMVPFNVVHQGQGHFHRGTSGDIILQEHPRARPVVESLRRCGIGARLHERMQGVLWSKLLLNLNNPINALVDIPLREELSQRGFRRALAACMSEAIGILRRAGITLERLERVPPPAIPWILRLPDALFSRVASSIIAIDPQARSSMWEDLTLGRVTEIDYINGEVVALAQARGESAPVNAAIVGMIKEAEAAKRSPRLSAGGLLAQLGLR
jgi:2-dehydropantoate 2-reductase